MIVCLCVSLVMVSPQDCGLQEAGDNEAAPTLSPARADMGSVDARVNSDGKSTLHPLRLSAGARKSLDTLAVACLQLTTRVWLLPSLGILASSINRGHDSKYLIGGLFNYV